MTKEMAPNATWRMKTIQAPALENCVDFYWVVLAFLKNVLEDIEGADGRLAYLLSLRCRLVEVLQHLDGIVSPVHREIGREHRLAFALSNGIDFLGVGGRELIEALRFPETNLSYEEYHTSLISFCERVLSMLPGPIPEAQGPLGQRQVLRAMRDWSKAAEDTGSDLSFLEERFRDL